MSLVDKIKNYRSRKKINADRFIDPGLFWAAANGAYIYGADEALDFVSRSTDEHQGIAMLGTYAGLFAGLYAVNRFIVPPIAKAIKNFHEKRKARRQEASALSWLRTAAQAGILAVYSLSPNFRGALNNIRYDGERVVNAFARNNSSFFEEEQKHEDITPDNLASLIPPELDLAEVRNSNIYSDRGRFLRAYRWDRILSSNERKYGLPKGLLSGLCMRESGCNPLELNSGNDGGAGAFMFQPGTARHFGLKVYGDSHASGRDRNHGFKLRELVKRNDWDYDRLSEIDERFDIRKSADAAARYLRDEYRKHDSWDRAVSAYNRGTPAGNPGATQHVRETNRFRDVYNLNRERILRER